MSNAALYKNVTTFPDVLITEKIIASNLELFDGEVKLYIDDILFPFTLEDNVITFQFYAITELEEGSHIIKVQKTIDGSSLIPDPEDFSNEITYNIIERPTKPEIEI